MVSDELSLVRFSAMNFFAVILNHRIFQPISTLLIKLVSSLIEAEPEPDKKMTDRVEWIYRHTADEVDIPLAIVELAVFKNLDRGLNREIEIGNKTFNLTELYFILDDIALELSKMVIQIAKKYSLDIPIIQTSQVQKISFEG